MSEQQNQLRVEGLRKLYGKKTAVADVSFSMHAGEVVGLLGPNGAGKTTVFYMIVGFIRASQGSIFLDDENISHMPMYQRARRGISYLSQEPSIFRKLSVEKNIWGILETRADLSREQKLTYLEELLTGFGIDAIRRQPAYTLSGGERRRTEIARNLAISPKFLLLDEPFAGIDPIAVNEIKSIITLLAQQGIGVLITDHNVRDTLDITHCSHVINHGEILVSGTKEELLANDIARTIYLGKDFAL
ncbi:MAG: LPS export ABC transporter ATP-binding protein [Spirochaetia bacterium]|nr:LPS export ABC transporter ATP-binding protein [Spirochaetia bacterium]MCF7940087.1 LPS export ABC transporter ATP-binding protein [Spirochaetia bacterium]